MGQLINQSWEHTQGEIWNEIKDQDRLYECRRVLPQQHKGIDCEALKNNKIRAISLHPLDDVYPLSDWILGDLFSTLNKIKFITILRLSKYSFQTYTAVGDKTVDQLGGGNHNESLYWDKIHELAEKLKSAGVIFIVEPTTRFEGMTGEQATIYFEDPFQNAIEFKAYRNPSEVFSK